MHFRKTKTLYKNECNCNTITTSKYNNYSLISSNGVQNFLVDKTFLTCTRLNKTEGEL